MSQTCTHMDQIKVTEPTTHVCEECVKMGDTWLHLRMCLICGNVGCCDSSKNKHATKALPQLEASADTLYSARRSMGVLLRG